MPKHLKIGLSLTVLILGGIIAAWEFSGTQSWLGWIITAIVAIMIFGLWVFPEAGGGKPAPVEGGSAPGR